MAAVRNLAIGRLRLLGADYIAKTTRAIRDAPEYAVRVQGITDSPPLPGTCNRPGEGLARTGGDRAR
ncbi:hypothetical protein H8N00_16235 [Streptomyces sp. AC563]|uniref:hypothetical protein n=1 Tax=Streptomyces buecherae TaxID=2763006 RepID=UPI00164E32AD|nr:hypothetical protein [Streptomyces buecherae]MBC3990397.1 hypothetical protein [Streptomyces buecherae]